MRRQWRHVILISALTAPLAGCGVELAVLGAAASAASTGSAVFKQGKLDASWMGPFDLVVAAGEVAVGDLGLLITETRGDPVEGEWRIVAVDEHGEPIKITVRRQSASLTEFQIDVGWFGRETTARLVLKRMAVAIGLNVTEDGTGQAAARPVPAAAEPETAPPQADTEPIPEPPETPETPEPPRAPAR
ncbi:MAG: DUF3568 family protein [Planctomycetota bacterium]